MTFLPRFLSACLATAFLHTAAMGQSDPLVSKSIPLVFTVTDKVFAFSEITGAGQSFSSLDLFANPPVIQNHPWPWDGGAQDGVPWRESLLLRSDVQNSDSTHVVRVASLYNNGNFSANDSLILPLKDSVTSVARGTSLTAMAVWHDTLILGFGRLGIAYAHLAPETSDTLFGSDAIAFSALPSHVDTTTGLLTCAWKRLCHVDTLHVSGGSLDSVVALTVDSSAPDSVWLLIATQSGLRRGLLGSRNFPHISLPGIADSNAVAVQSLFTQPNRHILWAFTDAAFFSADHGASFHIPDTVSTLTSPAILKSDANPPQVAFYGDTSFVNFNLKSRPGIVAFKRDTVLRSSAGSGLISDVLVESEDGLGITNVEGLLTTLTVVTSGSKSILAVGTDAKGIFYRRLDSNAATFSNLNRFRTVKGSLNEVITFPTLFGSEFDAGGNAKPVHLGYRLKKNGKVTITVFNYAMEKVRTVVKNRPRNGGTARSENPAEDVWDGKDGSGRFVSVGTYYILVESDQGERSFGKAICVGGRK